MPGVDLVISRLLDKSSSFIEYPLYIYDLISGVCLKLSHSKIVLSNSHPVYIALFYVTSLSQSL